MEGLLSTGPTPSIFSTPPPQKKDVLHCDFVEFLRCSTALCYFQPNQTADRRNIWLSFSLSFQYCCQMLLVKFVSGTGAGGSSGEGCLHMRTCLTPDLSSEITVFIIPHTWCLLWGLESWLEGSNCDWLYCKQIAGKTTVKEMYFKLMSQLSPAPQSLSN